MVDGINGGPVVGANFNIIVEPEYIWVRLTKVININVDNLSCLDLDIIQRSKNPGSNWKNRINSVCA